MLLGTNQTQHTNTRKLANARKLPGLQLRAWHVENLLLHSPQEWVILGQQYECRGAYVGDVIGAACVPVVQVWGREAQRGQVDCIIEAGNCPAIEHGVRICQVQQAHNTRKSMTPASVSNRLESKL